MLVDSSPKMARLSTTIAVVPLYAEMKYELRFCRDYLFLASITYDSRGHDYVLYIIYIEKNLISVILQSI